MEKLRKLLDELRALSRETEWVEFKINNKHPHEIGGNISALANSACLQQKDAGYLVFGIEDKNHDVVGTEFKPHKGKKGNEELENWLARGLEPRIDFKIYEFVYEEKDIVMFKIDPAFNIPVKFYGIAYIRIGSYTKKLEQYPEKARKIWSNKPLFDWSSQICDSATIDDLDTKAIKNLREKWSKESNRGDFLDYNLEKTLKNLGLITKEGITYTALILVGKSEAITRYLPDAEIIYEWRHFPEQTHYDFRRNWRDAFVNIDDDIWNTINARNIRISFQEGFFQREVWGFDEKSIREAIHNAVMHRDYSMKGQSIFIKASPKEFHIESPGGFPPGITLENVLREKKWRNRILSEAFEKIGFAERSSQGLDDIFERSIRDGKGLPDLSKSDANSVSLFIPAQVQDTNFILYLERVMKERQISLSFEEIYELEKVREHQKIEHIEFKNKFLRLGIIEPIGKGRGTKYILSQRYYETIGQSWKHTRIKGLSRDQIKELIINHVKEKKPSRRLDLISGFPECNPQDISNILQELSKAGKIFFEGSHKNGIWRIKK